MKNFFDVDDDSIEMIIPRETVEYQQKLILDLVEELGIKVKGCYIEDKELHCVIDKAYKNDVKFLQWIVKKQCDNISKLERSSEWQTTR